MTEALEAARRIVEAAKALDEAQMADHAHFRECAKEYEEAKSYAVEVARAFLSCNAERERMREALERLASNEGFDTASVGLDINRDPELVARRDAARAALGG